MSGNGEAERGPIVLAHARAFRIGALNIDPRLRRVAHDDGRENILEPRVMQVLVALGRNAGDIVSRDDLMTTCWGGLVVGEDSLNRVMSRLRRLGDGLAFGVFTVETITKVGYRLIIAGGGDAAPSPGGVLMAPGERPRLALPGKPSIAVLPFKNLSGETGRDYLADAITGDLVTALARWRWFFVIARHSSFTYRDRDLDPRRIGEELGVRYILTGSLAAAGSRVRVNAQLIDAADGGALWADKFDHELVDVFTLQDEITEQVVGVIEPAMLEGEAARSGRKSLADFSAMDCFYRGMARLNQITALADQEALQLFREAVKLDPDLALGHIGIARILYGQAIFGAADEPTANLTTALSEARIAIGLDAREAQGHFAAAAALLYLGDHAAALEAARTAISLNSSFAYAHYRLGQVLVFSGLPAQAIAPLERCLRLSPYDPQSGPILETLALAHYQARAYQLAAERAESAMHVSGAGGAVLAAALARLGRLDEAEKALAGVSRRGPSPQRPLAAPYANATDLEHLREGVRMAGMATRV
jgi:TolB-like protein/DNA-binding winged helix-turn-helix (wHTH) protein